MHIIHWFACRQIRDTWHIIALMVGCILQAAAVLIWGPCVLFWCLGFLAVLAFFYEGCGLLDRFVEKRRRAKDTAT